MTVRLRARMTTTLRRGYRDGVVAGSGFVEQIFRQVEQDVDRRTARGLARRIGDNDAVHVWEAGKSRAAPMWVTPLSPGYVRIGVGVLAECSLGFGPDHVDEALVEVAEWLDAVLDGRVAETVWMQAGTPSASRVVVRWRDGSRTRLSSPTPLAARTSAVDRQLVRYRPYRHR